MPPKVASTPASSSKRKASSQQASQLSHGSSTQVPKPKRIRPVLEDDEDTGDEISVYQPSQLSRQSSLAPTTSTKVYYYINLSALLQCFVLCFASLYLTFLRDFNMFCILLT